MTMLERVARAICESLETDEYDALVEDGIVKAAYRQQARDAIAAMREPSDAVIDAMEADGGHSSYRWAAGVDAALNERERAQ